MAIGFIMVVVGALLAFYYSGWTFDFGFNAAFLGPALLVFLGLLVILKKSG